MINYHLSKIVNEKIGLYKSINSTNGKGIEGFLIGEIIGSTPIIEDVFFIQFDNDSINQIYLKVLETYGTKLLGPVFIGKKKFKSEWFLEDIILEL